MAKRAKISHNSSSSYGEVSNFTPFPEISVLPDLAMDNIFKFYDWKTLSSCRLVCKTWYRLSLRGWLEAAPQIQLIPVKEKPKTLSFFPEVFYLRVPISIFLQKYIPSNLKLTSPYLLGGLRRYQNFSLENFAESEDPQKIQLITFMNRFGDNITNLELKNFDIGDKGFFFRDIMCSRFTPKLKTLKATISREIIFLDKKIQLPEGIQRTKVNKMLITLSISVNEDLPERQSPIEWLELLSHYPNMKNLELGNFSKEEVYSVMQAISKCGISIKSLHVFGVPASQTGDNFPVEGNLLKSLQIFQTFTNLVILTLQTELPIGLAAPHIPQGFRLDHLTTFYCNYGKWTYLSMDMLNQFMPNVTKLSLPLNDGSFRGICGHWTHLQELTMLGDHVYEEAITGISRDEGYPRNEENITKLQGLKSFKMALVDNFSSFTKFTTRHCVFNGFLCLPLLEELELLISDWTPLTRAVSEDIQTHLPYAKLTFPHRHRTAGKTRRQKRYYSLGQIRPEFLYVGPLEYSSPRRRLLTN